MIDLNLIDQNNILLIESMKMDDRKIIDNILFSGELDMLELRLNIMGDHVNKIIIVESDRSFTNEPKPYYFEDNKERYKKWLDKIVYIKAKSPCYENAWDNEHWSRNMFVTAWEDVVDDDVIIISDTDEILRPEVLRLTRHTNFDYYGYIMPCSYYKFNYVDALSDKIGYVAWSKAYRNVKKYNMQPSLMRSSNHYPVNGKHIHHSGWHFSWMGDKDLLIKKLKNFSHTEFNKEQVENNLNFIDELIQKNVDHMRQDRVKYRIVKLDNYFPDFILINKEKYKDYILPDTSETVYDYYPFHLFEYFEK